MFMLCSYVVSVGQMEADIEPSLPECVFTVADTSDLRGAVPDNMQRRYSSVRPLPSRSMHTVTSLPTIEAANAARFAAPMRSISFARIRRISVGTENGISAASVPGRSEYGNTWIWMNGERCGADALPHEAHGAAYVSDRNRLVAS